MKSYYRYVLHTLNALSVKLFIARPIITVITEYPLSTKNDYNSLPLSTIISAEHGLQVFWSWLIVTHYCVHVRRLYRASNIPLNWHESFPKYFFHLSRAMLLFCINLCSIRGFFNKYNSLLTHKNPITFEPKRARVKEPSSKSETLVSHRYVSHKYRNIFAQTIPVIPPLSINSIYSFPPRKISIPQSHIS